MHEMSENWPRTSKLCQYAQTSPEQLQRMLDQLDQNSVIPSQVESADISQDDHPQWSLYHDYLARAVLVVRRKTDRWKQLLEDRQKAFKQASTWLLK